MILVEHLAKSFPTRKQKKSSKDHDPRASKTHYDALRDVSFQCKAGEVMALLGPNGAGKTTVLRILSTAIKPSSGRVVIDGMDVNHYPLQARQRIGFLSASAGLYARLSARENLRYFGRLYGMKPEELDKRIAYLLDWLALSPYADMRTEALSSGMRQKVSIARAVLHEPKIIIFDEPTTGLDVNASKVMLDFIRHCKAQNVVVILSTHQLHEVEQVCDSLTILQYGTSVFSGHASELLVATSTTDLYSAFVHMTQKRVAL